MQTVHKTETAVARSITMTLDATAEDFLRARVSPRHMGRYISQLLMLEKLKILQLKEREQDATHV
jgi:hypothetical protein